MPTMENVYWPKWDSYDIYKYDFFNKEWMISELKP